jgi:hypothetical protein
MNTRSDANPFSATRDSFVSFFNTDLLTDKEVDVVVYFRLFVLRLIHVPPHHPLYRNSLKKLSLFKIIWKTTHGN